MATVRKPESEPIDHLEDGSEAPAARAPRLRVLPESATEPTEISAPASPSPHPAAQQEEIAWHAMSIDEVMDYLATDQGQGLRTEEAVQRLWQAGPNIVELPDGEERLPWWRTITWGMPSWPGSRGTRPRR